MQDRIGLAVGHVWLWFDWMQNLTTPIANVETGSMFYGQARMEVYIFGCLVYQRFSADSDVQVKHYVFISPIIEHTALFSDLMLDIVKERSLGKPGIKKVTFWSRCGPHFWAYEHLAYIQKSWWPTLEAVFRVCFFAEIHGKGLADALFAIVKGWLQDYMLTPDVVLKDDQEVFAALLAGAKKCACKGSRWP